MRWPRVQSRLSDSSWREAPQHPDASYQSKAREDVVIWTQFATKNKIKNPRRPWKHMEAMASMNPAQSAHDGGLASFIYRIGFAAHSNGGGFVQHFTLEGGMSVLLSSHFSGGWLLTACRELFIVVKGRGPSLRSSASRANIKTAAGWTWPQYAQNPLSLIFFPPHLTSCWKH